ncbi:hypothetical protein EXIGLDRAFT_310250, partial [Exidia glandulosa HHB12029]
MARMANSRISKARSVSPSPRKSDVKLSAASRRGKPEGHIPRPPNAFIIFRQELNKKSVSAGEAHQKSISSVACALWRQYREKEPERIKKYFDLAEQLKEEHKARYPDYVYRPRKRLVEKKRRQCRTTQEEEHVRKLAVLAAHGEDDGLLPVSKLPALPPTRPTRTTRSRKAPAKSEPSTADSSPSGFPSPLPDPETLRESWATESPDAYEVPALASSPSTSTPTSPISPMLATPLGTTLPLHYAPVSSTSAYEGLIQLPADFMPSLTVPVDFTGYEVDYNGNAQWNGFVQNTPAFVTKPEV